MPDPCHPCSSAAKSQPLLPLRRLVHACLLLFASVAAFPAYSQEDVAETKSKLQIDTTPITEPAITPSDREHWSFAPIQRPQLSTIQNPKSKIQNPIDLFILSKLETKNLSPSPEADRPTLLRRLTFDLTGLPPTPAELNAFESDKSPDAYERQLDRLLASPAFGERYAQHWLDLARFAETDGFEHDYVRSHAWRYRDWVIGALNSDLPYDDFVRQQLAGDEIGRGGEALREGEAPAEPPATNAKAANAKTQPPPKPGQVSSMFCLSGPDMPDVNDQAERRHILLNEMTAAVGSTFLGLQLGCAQCHNHKYDPISQADFYRLRAIFESAVPALKRDIPNNVLVNQSEPITARLWHRGDHRRPGLELTASFPRIASTADSALRTSHSALSAIPRSRSDLAEWLIAPSNPLTARVIANRLWQTHFGRGLCATPSDFGVMGGPLTHAELLDHLALDLRDHAWSLKHLHRQILTSATYRQASVLPEPRTLNPEPSLDPDNDLYSRFPRQRLTGEAIRDAMLSAAGLLSTERGGPGVMPPLPDELLSTLLKNQWNTSKRESDHYKRSIYVFARRNLRYPLFEAFDRPDGNASCALRNRSTTAPQSLLLFNSEISLLAAQHLAGRVLNDTSHPRDQIDRLYQITLSRRPTVTESITLKKFLKNQRARLSSESRPANDLALPIPCPPSADPHAAATLVDACLAILNTSEFVYVD